MAVGTFRAQASADEGSSSRSRSSGHDGSQKHTCRRIDTHATAEDTHRIYIYLYIYKIVFESCIFGAGHRKSATLQVVAAYRFMKARGS